MIVGLSIFLAGVPSAFKGKADLGFWRTAGLYWHFVDIIWFFVVSQIYFHYGQQASDLIGERLRLSRGFNEALCLFEVHARRVHRKTNSVHVFPFHVQRL